MLLFVFIGVFFGLIFLISIPASILCVISKIIGAVSWTWNETLIPVYAFVFSFIVLVALKLYSDTIE